MTEKSGTGSERTLHNFQEQVEKCFWPAIFGAMGGIVSVLCLNAVWKAERAGGEIGIQYEQPQNSRQPEENDKRFVQPKPIMCGLC